MATADQSVELADFIRANLSSISGLQVFAHTHPAGVSPLCAILPQPAQEIAPDQANRNIDILRVVVNGVGVETSIQNAWTVFNFLKDQGFNLTSFRMTLRAIEEPSLFRQENNLYYSNMRFRSFTARKEVTP